MRSFKRVAAVSEKWWVVFLTTPDRQHWWDLVTHPDMRHCLAFREISPGLVLMVDPRSDYVQMDTIAGWPDQLVQRFLASGARVLEYMTHDPDARKTHHRFGNTCASVLAYQFGIAEVIFKPHGLFAALVKRGARELAV